MTCESKKYALVWDFIDEGQLGYWNDVSRKEIVYHPTKLSIDNNISWTQIVCGEYHTVAINSNGEVFTWGYNGCGQLGHGDKENRNVPTKVESLSGENVVKVSCGTFHTVALTAKGKVLTWYVLSAIRRQLVIFIFHF